MKMLNIEEIVINNKYLRLQDDVDTLKQSIETVGLIHPLVVNKQNELIAGGRRYTALSQLGWTKIPVVVVDKGSLEQELISIEENMIRQKLTAVEFEAGLRRAKDIYEELFPETKEDLDNPLDEEQVEVLVEHTGRKPFALEIAQKVGCSAPAIRAAIKRDMESSSKVKKARETGDLTSAQASQLAKLDKQTQNDLLQVVVEKNLDSRDTRKLVQSTFELGPERAVKQFLQLDPSQKEYDRLSKTFKKVSKDLQRQLDIDSTFNGDELEKALAEAEFLKSLLDDFLTRKK